MTDAATLTAAGGLALAALKRVADAGPDGYAMSNGEESGVLNRLYRSGLLTREAEYPEAGIGYAVSGRWTWRLTPEGASRLA